MNYLAHAYLSFNNDEIMVGNLISDFVKGKAKFNFPIGIQRGIALHRAIDTFTDTHPANKKAKDIFRPHYRLYCGAFVDVVYDHFLATDISLFTDQTLRNFSEKVYSVLDMHFSELPARFARMFPYMKSQNWLYNYSTLAGTEASFGGLVRRARYLDESNTAAFLFKQHYTLLHECYTSFFPDLQSFAYRAYQNLQSQ